MRLFFILLTMLTGITHGVAQATYLSSFGGDNDDKATGVGILPNGYIVAGHTRSFGLSNPDIFLSRLDFSGNLLWSKIAGGTGTEQVNAMTSSHNNTFILTGYSDSFSDSVLSNNNIFIVKIDSGGNILWSRQYGSVSLEEGLSVTEAKNKDILVCGYTYGIGAGSEDAFVLRTDSNGAVKWLQTYGTAQDERFNSIVETSSGNIAVTGGQKPTASTQQIIGLLLDSSGNIKWQNQYDIDGSYFNAPFSRWGSQVLYLSDKHLLFGGTLGNGSIGNASPFMMKTDTMGNVTFARFYNFNSGVCGLNKVIEVNGNLCAFDYMQSIPILEKTSLLGARLWAFGYSAPPSYSIDGSAGDLRALPNGGYILVSSVHNGTNIDVSLVLTWPSGAAACGSGMPLYSAGSMSSSTVAVTALALTKGTGGTSEDITMSTATVTSNYFNECSAISVSELTNEPIYIHPNPCSERVFISNQNNSAFTSVRLYDVFGKYNIIEADGRGSIDVTNVEPGIYFFDCIFENGSRGRGKLSVSR